jgi:hypothetical protein
MVKTLKMLRYISISIGMLFTGQCFGQTLEPVRHSPQGFTLGINLAGPVNKIADRDRTGFSFISRANLMEDYFIKGESGFENVSFQRDKYHYESNGTFLKLGVEKDVLPTAEAGSNDNFLVGLHYGYALQEHGSSQYVIENGYWDDFTGRRSTSTLNTHWLEFSIGPRAEVFKNFYMSWNMHIRVSIIRDTKDIMRPYIIPGFGNGDNRLNAGFSYTLEYMIPWMK